jgi:hypothetical protein
MNRNKHKSRTVEAQENLWAVVLNFPLSDPKRNSDSDSDSGSHSDQESGSEKEWPEIEMDQFVWFERVVAWEVWLYDSTEDEYFEPTITNPITASTTNQDMDGFYVDHAASRPEKIAFVGLKLDCARWVKQHLLDNDSRDPDLSETVENLVEEVERMDYLS